MDEEDQRQASLAGMGLEEYRTQRDNTRKEALKQSARLSAIETNANAIVRLLHGLAELGWPAFPEEEGTRQRPYAVSPDGWVLVFGHRTVFLKRVLSCEQAHAFDEAIWLDVEMRGLSVEDLVTIAKGRVALVREESAAELARKAGREALQAIREEQRQVNIHRSIGHLAGTLFRAREINETGLAASELQAHERAWTCIRADHTCRGCFSDGGTKRRDERLLRAQPVMIGDEA